MLMLKLAEAGATPKPVKAGAKPVGRSLSDEAKNGAEAQVGAGAEAGQLHGGGAEGGVTITSKLDEVGATPLLTRKPSRSHHVEAEPREAEAS